MRLVIVQYAGDYAEAFQRLAEEGSENYYAQKYSVDAVTEMRKRAEVESLTVICCITPKFEDVVLENGVRAIACGFTDKINSQKLIQLIAQQNPTHLVMRATVPDVFKWAIKNKIRTIAVFAESVTKTWRNKIRNYFFAKLLNHQQIEWVGTYGITSSLLFKEIGVKPDKIIPWDFLLETNPGSLLPKESPTGLNTLKLFYAGALVQSKGVGDILEAVAKLRERHISVDLKMAGKGEEEFFSERVEELKIKDSVEFLGMIATSTLENKMRDSDVVLVTSRHEYPEGFPLTIQHALRTRTPIVASDHPMFRTHLKHGVNSMIFEAGNSVALAECLEKLISDSALYHNISVASHSTWYELRLSVKWAELIDRWLDDTPESKQWLFEQRLASESYNSKQS